jgi:hypothetical protein
MWGMGWLGWSEDQTLDTTMPSIIEAYEGRVDMLKAIFGDGKKPGVSVADPKKIASLLRSF